MTDERPEQPSRIFSDVGPYSIVPEWVLDSAVSDRSLRLFAVLARYADREGLSFPRRRTLAARLRCSVNTLDRALIELVQAGAVVKTPRIDDAGQRSNDYKLLFGLPGKRSPSAGAPLPVREAPPSPPERPIAIASIEEERELVNEDPLRESPLPASVDRKKTTAFEREAAGEILSAYNEIARQSLRSPDWLAKIISRLREHPELTLLNHRAIIEANFAAPWWKGPPSPAVIYGSGAQFEAAMQAGTGGGKLGMTTAQILKLAEEAELEEEGGAARALGYSRQLARGELSAGDDRALD